MPVFNVTLDNCADEPIHIPNLIQPNGFLIAIRLADKIIVQVSANAAGFLNLNTGEILGKPLASYFPKVYQLINKQLNGPDLFELYQPVHVIINSKKYNCVPHSYQPGILILEFEHETTSHTLSNSNFIRQLNNAILNTQQLRTGSELVSFSAKKIRQLTGYDRVMVYKFDQEYNGDVIAEEKTPALNSFLHHKFPASDIPKQARDLYLKNWVRIINDVDYKPISLVPAVNAVTGEFLDLSKSFLRSVSPIHIEYLKNMGVQATLTISIVIENKLWGLIACHHYQPKYINYSQRMGIEFFGKVLSNNWQIIEQNKLRTFKDRAFILGNKLLAAVRFSNDLNDTLKKFAGDLLPLTEATGMLIAYDDEFVTLGSTPPDAFCRELMDWLYREHYYNTFYTNDLQKQFEPAGQHVATASGILNVGFDGLSLCRIIWFRGEYITSVNWGGNPNEKQITVINEEKYRLTPRKSFDKWTEAVKGRSKDWEGYHVEAAGILKSNFAEILAWRNSVYKHQKALLEIEIEAKTSEITALYEQLLSQYAKLEAIAFEQSHIVRGPLSTIMGLLNLLDTETDEKEMRHIHQLIKLKTTELDKVITAVINKLG